MSELRQIPLFSSQPQTVDDITRHTTLANTVSLFQKHLLREGKSEHTVKAFTSDLQLLADFTGGSTEIGEYTTTRLNEFLDWLEKGRGVPCSRKSYARRVTTLKVYFKWLHEIGAIADDPAKAVLQRSGPAPLAVILTSGEVDAALAHGAALRRGEKPDARPELLFRLLLETGIKKGETMRLLPEHIDRTDAQHPVLTVKQGAKDVYKERRIPLSLTTLRILDEYLAQYTPRDTVFNCTARNLEYVLEDLGDGAGVPKKISFEMMRWTSAVRDYIAGVDPIMIRDRLGLSAVSWQETFGKIRRLAEEQQPKTV